MSHWLLDIRRRHWRRQVEDGDYAELLDVELPPKRTAFEALELVCLDLETTGLDVETAEILSIGWVVIRRNRVDLSTAAHVFVRPAGSVGDSATVHGMTDSHVAGGVDIGEAIGALVQVLKGRCLVVHHAPLDHELLDREFRRCFGAPVPVPVVDTLALEHRRRARAHHLDAEDSLRLGDLRRAYGLPWYTGHDARADALATAELLLAMVARHGGAARTRLADLLK